MSSLREPVMCNLALERRLVARMLVKSCCEQQRQRKRRKLKGLSECAWSVRACRVASRPSSLPALLHLGARVDVCTFRFALRSARVRIASRRYMIRSGRVVAVQHSVRAGPVVFKFMIMSLNHCHWV